MLSKEIFLEVNWGFCMLSKPEINMIDLINRLII
jgi:hypothetical protein